MSVVTRLRLIVSSEESEGSHTHQDASTSIHPAYSKSEKQIYERSIKLAFCAEQQMSTDQEVVRILYDEFICVVCTSETSNAMNRTMLAHPTTLAALVRPSVKSRRSF